MLEIPLTPNLSFSELTPELQRVPEINWKYSSVNVDLLRHSAGLQSNPNVMRRLILENPLLADHLADELKRDLSYMIELLVAVKDRSTDNISENILGINRLQRIVIDLFAWSKTFSTIFYHSFSKDSIFGFIHGVDFNYSISNALFHSASMFFGSFLLIALQLALLIAAITANTLFLVGQLFVNSIKAIAALLTGSERSPTHYATIHFYPEFLKQAVGVLYTVFIAVFSLPMLVALPIFAVICKGFRACQGKYDEALLQMTESQAPNFAPIITQAFVDTVIQLDESNFIKRHPRLLMCLTFGLSYAQQSKSSQVKILLKHLKIQKRLLKSKPIKFNDISFSKKITASSCFLISGKRNTRHTNNL